MASKAVKRSNSEATDADANVGQNKRLKLEVGSPDGNELLEDTKKEVKEGGDGLQEQPESAKKQPESDEVKKESGVNEELPKKRNAFDTEEGASAKNQKDIYNARQGELPPRALLDATEANRKHGESLPL